MRILSLSASILLCLSLLSSCRFSSRSSQVERVDLSIHIERLDIAMDLWLKGEIDSLTIAQQYAPFLSIYGNYILETGSPNNPEFWKNSRSFLCDSNVQKLYQDALQAHKDLSTIEQELNYGFKWLKLNFPTLPTPRVMIHFSALNQSIVVAEGVISASGDKYLGASYPLYEQIYDQYQRRVLEPSRMSQDYLYGWIGSELTPSVPHKRLLQEIIYRGKMLYFISQMLPDRSEHELLDYSVQQLEWCQVNSENIWRYIANNELLYTDSGREIVKWISEAPNSSFIHQQAPPKLGIWLGYQIVKHYMKHHPISAHALYEVTADQNFVVQSKYRP